MAVGVGILYNSGDFAILFLYCWQLMYVFDFVCFIPSKSQTIVVTCGYSISVSDTSFVQYHTAPTHY